MSDLFIQQIFGHAILRNAVTGHSSGSGHHIKNCCGKSEFTQIICCGQSGRTSADNSNFFAAQFRKIFHERIVTLVSSDSFEFIDRHRFAVDVAAALFFAETRTNPADSQGHGNTFFDDLQSFFKISIAGGSDVLFHVRMSWTGKSAGGFAIAIVLAE